MKILFLSDLHTTNFKYPTTDVDLVVLMGDIPWEEVKRIDELFTCEKIGILGNHDRLDTFDGLNITNIHDNVYTFNDFTFAGFGGCPYYNGRDGQYTEDDVRYLTDNIGKVDFFIAHSNPKYGNLEDKRVSHQGFQAFNDYIHEKKPQYFLHGHIHKSFELKIEETNVVSVYPYFLLTIK